MISSEKARKLKGLWAARDSQMTQDRDILRFISRGKTKEGFEQVILNEGKVLYDTCVGLLSSNFPKIALPVHYNANEEEKRKMSKVERFLQGITRQLDRQHIDEGGGQWLRELAYWVISGWVTLFVYIDAEGNFRADFYDPITIYPRWAKKGLVEVARIAQIPTSEAIALAKAWNLPLPTGIDKSSSDIELINYWERKADGVYNTILFAGKAVKPETLEDFEEIPIIIGLANGSPEKDDPSQYRQNLGQSVLASNRLMYKQLDRWVSMLMQIAADTAYPPIQTATASGEAIFGKDDLGSGVVIPTKIGEEIKPFQYAGAPIEVNTLLSIISGATQRGGLPHVIYGGLPFELSGFAISQLLAAVQYKVSPYMLTMQQILGKIFNVFIEEFRRKGKEVTLSVSDKHGQFFVEEFAKAEIPKVQFIEVTIPQGTPQDKMQKILTARQALTPPALLSKHSLWEDYLDVEDPQLEDERILQDQVNDLPAVKLLRVVDDLRKRAAEANTAGNAEEARTLMGYAQLIIGQLTQQIQGGAQGGGGAYPGSAGQGFRQGRVTPEQERAARGGER